MIPLWVNSLLIFSWKISSYIVYSCVQALTLPCRPKQTVNSAHSKIIKKKKKYRGVGTIRGELKLKAGGGGELQCWAFESSPTVEALTASCLSVTLCGLSQTWAFFSHTLPIRAIIVVMIPFISASLWIHLFSKVILYWLIVMDWLDWPTGVGRPRLRFIH